MHACTVSMHLASDCYDIVVLVSYGQNYLLASAVHVGMATPGSAAKSSGLAIIISNDYKTTAKLETLSGTIKDGEKMNSTFQFLKFETRQGRNVTREELMKMLYKVSQSSSLPQSYKCIAFVFSGHGLDANQLYMQDGSLITVQSIVESLLPKTAPQIGTIPKVFFIDACRGERTLSEEAIVVPRKAGGKVQRRGGLDATFHIPPEGNFLIAYSTMPRYQSYELKGEGGLWMTSLAEKLRTSYESIQDILSETNRDLMEMFQAPEFRQSMMQPECFSRLHGRLCLQPEGNGAPARKGEHTHNCRYGSYVLPGRPPSLNDRGPVEIKCIATQPE